MSGNGINGSVAGSRASVTRNGTRASARSGFIDGADAVSKAGRSRYRTQQNTQPVDLTPELLELEKVELLASKQAELEKVVDRHDDLVRELFHMENFTMMLSYDPAEAKTDQTAVFREYKSKYDLIDNAAPGPSRQTRGRHNERRQIFSSPTISAPLPSLSAKRKGKSKMNTSQILETLHNAASTVKGKGKVKEVTPSKEPVSSVPRVISHHIVEPVSTPLPVPTSTSLPVSADAAATTNPEPLHVPTSPTTPTDVTPATTSLVPIIPAPISKEGVIAVRRKSERKMQEPPTEPALSEKNEAPSVHKAGPEEHAAPSEQSRKISSARILRNAQLGRQQMKLTDIIDNVKKTPSNAHKNGIAPCPTGPPEESISVALKKRNERSKAPLTVAPSPITPKIKLRLPVEDQTPLREPLAVQSNIILPSPSKVKRIKLIVRRPLHISNPRQLPPKPKFNSSLPNFLSSYINIDEEGNTLSALEEEAKSEAAIKEQVVRFRREGRFIPGTDVLFGTEPPTVEYVSPQRTTTDIWDHVVEAVIARGRTKPKKSIGRQIASQIASKVQAHFDGQESRKVKAKEAEERRLRNLAKSAMKTVIGEWKKAVYHIREKQRLKQEAEERRIGRAHLDAILDQSGQLLETQQGDLSRGDLHGSRSRTGSIRDFDTDEEDEDEEEDDGEGDDGDDEEEEIDEDDDEIDESGTKSLLGGTSVNESEADNRDPLLFTPRSLASPTTSEAPTNATLEHTDQDDPDVSTAQLLSGDANRRDMDMDSVTSFDQTLEVLAIPEPESSSQRPPRDSALRLENISPSKILGATVHKTGDIPIPNLQPATRLLPLNTLGLDYGSQFDSDSDPLDHEDNDTGSQVPETSEPQPPENPKAQKVLSSAVSENPVHNEILVVQELRPDTQEVVDDDDVLEGLADTNEHADGGRDSEKEDEEEAQKEEKQQGQEEEQEKEPEPESEMDIESRIPDYLKPYAAAPVEWDPDAKVTPPLLLRGVLRPYQQSGLEWLASLHVNKLNGILADEMGLGKTIQTIALLAHLACDRGIWGPHLIVVPTSVLLNWEMEFKKFLPGFRVLSYHGTTKRRKELRQGWNDKHRFNVCITSYTLASRDAHIFKRKAWYYMILDEAHMIKNFKSQRWNILLMFRSYRRLLLTGTPLQNNLTELWALLQFLMSGANFANLKEFGEWFSNPLEKAIEMGGTYDDETMQRVSKLHTVLRPYLLRRLKRDVEKELPSKFDHLTLCPLSRRQRFLYDEFMSRAQTRDALESGVYQKIANVLMQLRKVCNHPDLFEVRPIVTSFAMSRSAIADYEIMELLVRRRFLMDEEEHVDLNVIGLRFVDHQNVPLMTSISTRSLNATKFLPYYAATPGDPPPKDTRTVAGFRNYSAYLKRANDIARWSHIGYLNNLRCSRMPLYPQEMISVVERMSKPIIPFAYLNSPSTYLENVDRVNQTVKSYMTRANEMASLIDHFAFATPAAVALDLPRIALSGYQDTIQSQPVDFDEVLHRASVKLQIAFPDPSLLQYDCGKLQKLAALLRDKKNGGHRVLIFTQMTRILDILEIFLNFHGYLYLRLDGATKIEDRQYITERFNADPRIFCFIASSRSGGVGINLTGADTVVFYDSDFNPQMDKQCEDRAHRIGQIRDVHIYRFISQHTVEEAMLLKANQKRSLDDLVIQKGEFDWRTLFNDEGALTNALGDFEDAEDRRAAMIATREEISLVGADEDDFGEMGANAPGVSTPADVEMAQAGLEEDLGDVDNDIGAGGGAEDEDDEDQGGSVVDYMLAFIEKDYEYFRDWRL